MKKDELKAFTLIELVVVILIISLVYYVTFSSFSVNKTEKEKLLFTDMKSYLINSFEYTNKLKLSCIKDDKLSCFIIIDNDIENMKKVHSFFEVEPKVYNYDENLTLAEFRQLRYDNISYDIFFDIEIDSDKKHQNYVVEYENRFYVIKSISEKIKIYDDSYQIFEEQNNLKEKIKNAL